MMVDSQEYCQHSTPARLRTGEMKHSTPAIPVLDAVHRPVPLSCSSMTTALAVMRVITAVKHMLKYDQQQRTPAATRLKIEVQG